MIRGTLSLLVVLFLVGFGASQKYGNVYVLRQECIEEGLPKLQPARALLLTDNKISRLSLRSRVTGGCADAGADDTIRTKLRAALNVENSPLAVNVKKAIDQLVVQYKPNDPEEFSPLPCGQFREKVKKSCEAGAEMYFCKPKNIFFCNSETGLMEREILDGMVEDFIGGAQKDISIHNLLTGSWAAQKLTEHKGAQVTAEACKPAIHKLESCFDHVYLREKVLARKKWVSTADCLDNNPIKFRLKTCADTVKFLYNMHFPYQHVITETLGVTGPIASPPNQVQLFGSLYDYSNFASTNEWFFRKLNYPANNPVNSRPVGASEVVSMADCRLVTFSNMAAAQKFWVKGKGFTMGNFLGPLIKPWAETKGAPIEGDSAIFDYVGGRMVIQRLVPQDYHRYHFPVEGRVKFIGADFGENLLSVNAVVVNSEHPVFTTNKRKLVIIESPILGEVAIVIIGAVVVGSIKLEPALIAQFGANGLPKVGDGVDVHKGESLGWFEFGGSTIIMCFRKTLVGLRDVGGFFEELNQPAAPADAFVMGTEVYVRQGQAVLSQ